MGQRHHSDGSKDYLERLAPQAGVRAVMMDPHTGAQLSTDEIVAMCDELIEAHGHYLPKYN